MLIQKYTAKLATSWPCGLARGVTVKARETWHVQTEKTTAASGEVSKANFPLVHYACSVVVADAGHICMYLLGRDGQSA